MPDNWTYIVEEPRRSELLKEWGVPDLIIQLGSGSVPDEVFDFNCRKPKFVFKDDAPTGDAEVVGIFESQYDEAFACRKKGDGMEYIYFNVRHPGDIEVHGGSEQALLRSLFDQLVDSEFYKRDDIERAAKVIGFECLADTFAFIFAERERAMQGSRKRDMKAYFKRRLDYVQGISKPGTDNPGV